MANVRVPTDFPTIAAAMSNVNPGDTIVLDPGYSNETATVSVNGLTIDGTASSLNIHLQLGFGVLAVNLGGDAPMSVADNASDNAIVGNAGANMITVTAGNDVVDGGAGSDRLVVDYSAATLPVSSLITNPLIAGTTDGYAGSFTDLVGLISNHSVIFNNIDSFDIRTGSANDTITTGGGDDTIEGGGGADAINGGAGFDFASYAHSNAAVTVNLSTNAGNSGGDAGGDTLSGIEGIIGSAFNDALIAFTNGSAAVLIGGAGNDNYTVFSAAQQVVEQPGQGSDVVWSTASYTIPANVEALYVVGTGLTGTGSAGDEILGSFNGANTLMGLGGNDNYYVHNVNDVVIESANGGMDNVWASINYSIPFNVESLYMSGTGLTGTGSSAGEYLGSFGGANTLVGLGGDDGYYVNNVGDRVLESVNQGSDTIWSTVNYTIADNVEHLFEVGAGLIGTGSGAGETLGSTGGPNTLIGKGGDDAYYVANTGDVVIENINEGADVVWASVNYTIPNNVEYLYMNGSGLAGAGSIGNDNLGSFGTGNTLTGNGGNDTFIFVAGSAAGNVITDFNGNGALPGDQLELIGFGPGATFTRLDATHWDIGYASGQMHEVITLSNAASVHPSDVLFV